MMSSIAEQIRTLRGWAQDCQFLLEWQKLPNPNGWVEFSTFDPGLIRRDLDRITLIDASDPSDPIVLIRGERLNGVTTQIIKGEPFLRAAAPASRAQLAHIMAHVGGYPCIAVHDVLYKARDGALAARGEVVLLPFIRSARSQKLVMACTRLDEVHRLPDALEPGRDGGPVEIVVERLAYFDFGYNAPEPSGAAAVHPLDLGASGRVA